MCLLMEVEVVALVKPENIVLQLCGWVIVVQCVCAAVFLRYARAQVCVMLSFDHVNGVCTVCVVSPLISHLAEVAVSLPLI